jgi:hypothetical protein
MIIEAVATLAVLGLAAKLIQGRRGRGAMPDGRSPVTIQNRVMRGPTGATYTLTDDDLLWLGRAIYGEAGTRQRGGAAVAWAMAQNYMMTGPGGGPRFAALPTFTALLRAYCQPINPAWMDPNGPKCQRNPAACTERHLARRRSISGMSWESLPQSVRNIVQAFAEGTLPNEVPGLTDWATPRWAADNVEIDGNFFGAKQRRRRPA